MKYLEQKQMKTKITDRQLMMFVDGEISYTDELFMSIVAGMVQDSPQGEELRKRLDLFIKTRSILKQLIEEKNEDL